MKKALASLINIICILMIVASVGVLFSVVTTPKGQPPQVLGFSGFRVLTGSMNPSIPTNSFVLVRNGSINDVKEGDVISFYSLDPAIGGAVNTHRVVEIENDGGQIRLTTKGDNNQVEDQYFVYESNYIGKVVFVSHLLGVFIRLISNPLVFGIFIVIPLILIIVVNIKGIAKDVKSMMDSDEDL